ncbi:MAG: hypothetical protein JXR94_23735 [Candidatus Hydrogenedentes bacterium]|nr:hypothetical protein [Candidatus Hydrogenedentota bacterium]
MMYAVLALATHLAAGDEFAPRIETLRFHVERLGAITVPEALEAEKTAKLAELGTRLDAGAETEEQFNELYRAIDAVRTWLWENAADKPTRVEGRFEETDTGWTVTGTALTLHLAKQDLAMSVDTGTHTWQFAPCDNTDVDFDGPAFSFLSARSRTVVPFNTGYSIGLNATLGDFPEAPGFEIDLCANLIGNEMVIELAARQPETNLCGIYWPKAVETGNTERDLAVIPYMQGMLLPGNWGQDIHHKDLSNSRSLYMPWWGQIVDGHGVQVILETSDDGGAAYHHPAGGPTRIAPMWYASLGKLGYQRIARYVFEDDASYVTMAKRYRRYVQEDGRFVSLAEKRVASPALDEIIGRPVVHIGALYHFVEEASLFNRGQIERNHQLITFDKLAEGLRNLKAAGIGDAYVHLDGWGFRGYDSLHPDPLPAGEEQGGWDGLRRFADTCHELGYLFAVHDQYRDFYFNAVSFDDRLAVTRLDGGREEHSIWPGGPQTMLSARFAPEYVRRNHDLFAANGVRVQGAYLDVFSVVPLEESAQAAHPMTRSECGRHRRACFDLLKARGYVVSSEEPAEYLVRTLHLVHHGPYATFPGLGGGDATGIPVPLFTLVYHDSLLLPWEMGDDGGWGIPRGDAGWLHCLLNAGLPYVGLGASGQAVERVNEAAALAARCGTLEMTNHEFLDGSRRKQRSTFSDGTQVTVDFDTKEYTIQHGQ